MLKIYNPILIPVNTLAELLQIDAATLKHKAGAKNVVGDGRSQCVNSTGLSKLLKKSLKPHQHDAIRQILANPQPLKNTEPLRRLPQRAPRQPFQSGQTVTNVDTLGYNGGPGFKTAKLTLVNTEEEAQAPWVMFDPLVKSVGLTHNKALEYVDTRHLAEFEYQAVTDGVISDQKIILVINRHGIEQIARLSNNGTLLKVSRHLNNGGLAMFAGLKVNFDPLLNGLGEIR
jgi:hypothetical protein